MNLRRVAETLKVANGNKQHMKWAVRTCFGVSKIVFPLNPLKDDGTYMYHVRLSR